MLQKMLQKKGVHKIVKAGQKQINGGFSTADDLKCRTFRDCQDPRAFCMNGYCFI